MSKIKDVSFSSWKIMTGLFLLVVASRVLTSIHYIADPDSLRFALAASDFDLTTLRPHFPGYPVFCFFLQLLTSITGKFSIAFSLIGGAATFIITCFALKLNAAARWEIPGWLIAAIVCLNSMIWIMGNRYMPDLAGLAVVTAALYFFYTGKENKRKNLLFLFLAGILAGTRLSYLPVLLLPMGWSLIKRGDAWKQVLAGAIGVVVWLVPMIMETGWDELIDVALRQTVGHFNDWGGTIETEPSLYQRTLIFFESVVADGLGGYWSGRHWLTLVFSILTAAFAGLAIFSWRKAPASAEGRVLLLSFLLYAVWVFLMQNIIYNPRHIMPLLLPLLLLVAKGASIAIAHRKYAVLFVLLFFVLNGMLTLQLVRQHREPTAIAQAAQYLHDHCGKNDIIISTELINYYLVSTGVSCSTHTIHSLHGHLPALDNYSKVITIGNFDLFPGRTPLNVRNFYHNPYVNRIWAGITVREYGRISE